MAAADADRVALGYVPTHAEDVVQTALLRCYVSWSRVQRAEYPDAYVYRVLVNTINDSRRRRWNGELPSADPGEDDSGVDPTDGWITRHEIERALGRLTADQRMVVVLRYFLDQSEQQMATILRVPAGTVKSRLSRAVVALAEDPCVIELGDPT